MTVRKNREMIYHPDHTLPEDDSIWVFGSNLSGRHGAGAALVAAKQFEAKRGVGVGPTGKSYAIPTKDFNIQTMSLKKIEPYVDNFVEYSAGHPDQKFFITRVGCGLAGHSDQDMSFLFAKWFFSSKYQYVFDNCSFPEQWATFLIPEFSPSGKIYFN